MPKAIVVDDNANYVVDMLTTLIEGDYPFNETDVEGWWINGITTSKKPEVGYPSYVYEIGFNNAIDEISRSDAELLVTDLDFERDVTKYIVSNKQPDLFYQNAKATRLPDHCFGGALIIHHYLTNNNDVGKYIIVASDHYAKTMIDYLENYTKNYDGNTRTDLSVPLRNIYQINIDARIWPTYVNDWYDNEECDVPHNKWTFEIGNSDSDADKKEKKIKRKESVKALIMKYLNGIFRENLPDEWLDSNNRFEFFWEDLKHLVGAGAICCGGKRTNALTLGNVVLLFAVASKDAIGVMPKWFEDQMWNMNLCHIEILPKNQTKEQACNAVKRLINGDGKGLFENIQKNEESQEELVKNVLFDGAMLMVSLGFNVAVRSEHKPNSPSMLEKFNDLKISGDGQLYHAFTGFLRDSAVTARGYEPRCAIKLYYDNYSGLSIFKIQVKL